MPRVDGIDISHHNTVTDWSQVPDFRFAIHKINEGTAIDRRWAERMPVMRDKFEMYGGYTVLIYSPGGSSIRKQMETYARLIEPYWGDGAFTQLDVEPWKQYPRPVNADEIDEARTHHFRLLGRDAIVYMNPRQMPGEYNVWRARNPHAPYWEAHYGKSGVATTIANRATIHQWTSTYRCPGFTAGIDANEVRDWATVERIANLNPTPPPTSGPDPVPEPPKVEDDPLKPAYLVRYPGIATFTPDGLLITDDLVNAGVFADVPVVDSDPATDVQFQAFLNVNGPAAAYELGKRAGKA